MIEEVICNCCGNDKSVDEIAGTRDGDPICSDCVDLYGIEVIEEDPE